MSTYIKRFREEAGLTQAKLAEKMDVSVVAVQNWENGKTGINPEKYSRLSEILNVPLDNLIKEMIVEADTKAPSVWPDFLFDDTVNNIVDTLHLNLAQQHLFGLLYIYDSEYLNKNYVDADSFKEDLKRIPYDFIDRVGSIKFLNQAEGLHRVVRYVKADFLMRVLRLNPDCEFNIKKLSKDLICEFIDFGHRQPEDCELWGEPDEILKLRISMRKSKIMLPILEKIGPVHITDSRWSNPIRKDIPAEFLEGVIEMCGFDRELFAEGHYTREYNISNIRSGLELVTDYKNVAENEEKWLLEINEKGRELLKWLKN